ncbi:MAG: hypothetical protein EPO64_11700 [Nitrospirae bacterium]|nr:MAG: hypothetical protein EPO64_11700 [Nitrospirota bacterium]
MLYRLAMDQQESILTPETVSQAVQNYLDERHTQILPPGDRSSAGRRFGWCGDVLEFLVEGIADRFASHGIAFNSPYPGPFRLWDEDQHQDGEHVRRFWTTAVDRDTGCPIAKLCTFFFHRHDTAAIPNPPRVVGFPADDPADEADLT